MEKEKSFTLDLEVGERDINTLTCFFPAPQSPFPHRKNISLGRRGPRSKDGKDLNTVTRVLCVGGEVVL